MDTNGSISIPSRALTRDEIKSKIKEIETNKWVKPWKDRHNLNDDGTTKKTNGTWLTYISGYAQFLILTGLTPADLIKEHARWLKDSTTDNQIAKLLGDADNVRGTFTDYLINVTETYIVKLDGKEQELNYAEYSELKDSGKKFKLIQKGYSRGVSSLRHSGVRSFISFKWPQKGSGLPVGNIPKFDDVQSGKYKPDFNEILKMTKVANPAERKIILMSLQLTFRPVELLKLTIDQDTIDQMEAIEKNRLPNGEYNKNFPPIIIVSHRPASKGKGGKTIGIRSSAFGFDAYEAFKDVEARRNGGILPDFQSLKGRPLFEGNGGTAYNAQRFGAAYTRPAKIIGLDKKAKKRDEKLSIYGLRSTGQTAWELNAKMKDIKNWVTGHTLEGVGKSYFTDWRVKEEYIRGIKYLNPSMGAEQYARSLEESISNNSNELSQIKAENAALREEQREIKRMLAGGTAAAFKKEVSQDTAIPPEVYDLLKDQAATIADMQQQLKELKAT